MKKYINKIIPVIVLSALITISACDDFGDMNVNPNEPTSVAPSSLVTQAMFSSVYEYWDRTANFEMGMLFVQHFAQAEYTEEQRYNFNASNFDFIWGRWYAGSLSDIKAARDLIEADESLSDAQKANQLAVLDIMESFVFQIVTDVWGDVPYSEALNPDEFVQPKYDTQSSIYEALIDKVSDAVDAIDVNEAGFSATSDIIYAGDMDGWQKFGNALLLRMGMRVSDVNASLASQAVTKALGGNIISSVNDEAKLVFKDVDDIANPFWYDAAPVGGSRDDFRVSEELLSRMDAMGDPRIPMYADSTATGEYVGMPYGLEDGPSFELKPTTSRFAASIRAKTAPAYILRYSEVKLLEAEAIADGIVNGDAAAAYDDGVTAAMNEWGISDTDAINDYLAANPYVDEESIALQMWYALYTNGLEAWASWRRYDFPVLQVPTSAFKDFIPVRGLYPTDEGATNEVNKNAVPYDDVMSTKLWWDVN